MEWLQLLGKMPKIERVNSSSSVEHSTRLISRLKSDKHLVWQLACIYSTAAQICKLGVERKLVNLVTRSLRHVRSFATLLC